MIFLVCPVTFGRAGRQANLNFHLEISLLDGYPVLSCAVIFSHVLFTSSWCVCSSQFHSSSAVTVYYFQSFIIADFCQMNTDTHTYSLSRHFVYSCDILDAHR